MTSPSLLADALKSPAEQNWERQPGAEVRQSSAYRVALLALLLFLVAVAGADAAPIYSQTLRNTAFPSEREFDTLIADDFSIAANDTARSVSWLGTYAFDGTAPAVDDFEIRFYADAAGNPGALLQTFAVGNAVGRTAVGTLGSFTEYAYAADLGAGFNVSGGTPYWLVISNDTTGEADNWYWAVQLLAAGNVRLSQDDGASWGMTNPQAAAEAAFVLDNANVVVPEPGSLFLLGIGIAVAMRRTRVRSGRGDRT